jgi:hypothetical protein
MTSFIEDLMPIRIISCDNRHQEAQATDSEGITVPIFDVFTARHADPKLVLRILCGSI